MFKSRCVLRGLAQDIESVLNCHPAGLTADQIILQISLNKFNSLPASKKREFIKKRGNPKEFPTIARDRFGPQKNHVQTTIRQLFVNNFLNTKRCQDTCTKKEEIVYLWNLQRV